MTIKPSSHPSAGWHKGDCHPPAPGGASAAPVPSAPYPPRAQNGFMWQFGRVFFPPFSWFLSLENGLWNLHGGSLRYGAGCPKGPLLLARHHNHPLLPSPILQGSLATCPAGFSPLQPFRVQHFTGV